MKKIMSLLLSIVLCVSLIPAQCYIATATTTDSVVVAGQSLTVKSYWINDGKGGITQDGANEENYNLYYNGSYTFKLRNLNISKVYEKQYGYKQLLCNFGIYIGSGSSYTYTFELDGNNVVNISAAQSVGDNYGIFSNSALKFTGQGTLTCSSGQITGENQNTYSYGIYSYGIEVLNAMVKAYSADVEGKYVGSFGVHSTKNIVVDNGILQTQSGVVTDSSGYMNSIGAVISNNLEVKNGGKIEATAGTSTEGSGDSIGIQASSIVMNGGTVHASSSEAKIFSFGFYVNDITVNEGQLIATGGNSQNNNSYGIRGDVNLVGGSVISSGDNGSFRNSLTIPETYWWRTSEEVEYQSNSKVEYTEDESYPYVDITTVRPTWTITFDANGGFFENELTTNKTQTNMDGTITSFPDSPTRKGYLFNGWYDAATSGTVVNETNIYDESTTIYAQWVALTKPSYLYVGNTRITTEGYWLNDGSGSLTTESADVTNYNVYYDGSGTLYLNNLDIITAYNGYGLYIPSSGRFQIIVSGDNKVDISSVNTTYKSGLYTNSSCDLYIKGTGSLTCIASNDEQQSTSTHRGVYVGDLIIDGATVKGSVGKSSSTYYGYGVYTTSLTIESGELHGIASDSYYSYGIYVTGKVDCDNSVIYAISGDASKYSYALYCTSSSAVDLVIKNSEVHASSGTVSASTSGSRGISVPSSCVLQIENSKVYSTALDYNTSSTSSYSYGIYGSVKFISGSIYANGIKSALSKIPTLPEYDYWWRESNTGRYIKNNYVFVPSIYCEMTTESQEEIADSYVLLDTNGGSFPDGTTQKRFLVYEGKIEQLELIAEPQRTDYYFQGWYDASSGGNKIDLSDIESLQVTTLYAQWLSNYRPTTFYIGSTKITSAGYWKNNDAGSLTQEGAGELDYNVYYDGINGLILKDVNITTGYSNCGIYASGGNLNIEIIGENTIDISSVGTSSSSYGRGLFGRQLKLFGNGKLTVISGLSSMSSYAVYGSNSLTIEDVELQCNGGAGKYSSYGLYSPEINVSNAKVKAITSTTETQVGIWGNNIVIAASDVNCDDCDTVGIKATGNILIEDSTVSSISNITAIQAVNMNVVNSDVFCQGSTQGLDLTGNLEFISGTLVVKSSNVAIPYAATILAKEYWWRTADSDLYLKDNYSYFSTKYIELTTREQDNVAKGAIIFDAEERTFTDETSIKMIILENGYISQELIPTLNTYAGYHFNYWQMTDGTEVDFTSEFTDVIHLVSKFTQPTVLLANTDISQGGYWVNDGSGGITSKGASIDNYNLYYDGAGNMTLNGFVITEGTNYLRTQYTSGNYGLYSTTNLMVTVLGENKIDISEEVVYVATYGIYGAGTLTILGDGSLYIHAKTSSNYTSSNSYGIYAGGAVKVTNVNLEVIGEGKSDSSSYLGYGIYGTTTLTLIASDVMAKGSYGIYTKSGMTLNENAKLHAISVGNRNYESIYGSIVINTGTIIAERTSTGKCFNSTPTFSTDYWWRNQNQGNYLLNTYVSENSHYEELTTEQPDEVALTYVTLNANGGTIDGVTSKTFSTDESGNITKEIFAIDPIYYNYYFDGWFTETEYTNEVDLYNTTFSEPTTLYAKWNAIEVAIGDVNVSDGGYWINDGNGNITQNGANETNYNVFYDGNGNLVLRNINISGKYKNVTFPTQLYFNTKITVTLMGDNIVNSQANTYNIYSQEDIVFSGTGSLTTVLPENADVSSVSRGLYAVSQLTIDGVRMYINAPIAKQGVTSYGVYAGGVMIANGGALQATGAEANTASSYGIYVQKTLEMVEGEIKGVGGTAYNCSGDAYSYGVYANEIIVSKGKLEGIAGKAYRPENWDYYPTYCSNGIYGNTLIDISGGEVVGIGDDVDQISGYGWTYGIRINSNGTLNINGGKIIGLCGEGTANRTSTRAYGLYVSGATFNMTDGELILEKGMSNAPSVLPSEYRWRTTETGAFTYSADVTYTYSANDYLQIISENMISEKYVTLYSITTNGTLSVSQVSGGGIYNVSNTVQIEAESLGGYMFKGWYVASVNEDNECVGYDADAKVSDDIVYSFAIEEDVQYVAVYEKLTSKLIGYTLSLYGDIAVNIHMTLMKDVLEDDTAYLKITFADSEVLRLKIGDSIAKEINGTKYYVFTCGVQAPEMRDSFEIELITESGNIHLDTYSVKEYADYILEHTADSEDYAKAAPMVRAMLNYGGYSQLQFQHNIDSLANEGLYDAEENPVLTDEIAVDDRYTFTAPSEDIGLQYYGSSLLLNAETTIRHYFTITGDEDMTEICNNYTFVLGDGTVLKPSMRGSMIYLDIKSINAAELDDIFILVVKNVETEKTISVTYSPLSYAKYVLENSFVDTNLMNVIKALCLYNKAANNYFEQE